MNEYEKLRLEKNELNEKIFEIRKFLGIRKGSNLQRNLPRHIVTNPLFGRYKRYCAQMADIDRRIREIPKNQRTTLTSALFMQIVQQDYPDVFKNVLQKIGRLRAEDKNAQD